MISQMTFTGSINEMQAKYSLISMYHLKRVKIDWLFDVLRQIDGI